MSGEAMLHRAKGAEAERPAGAKPRFSWRDSIYVEFPLQLLVIFALLCALGLPYTFFGTDDGWYVEGRFVDGSWRTGGIGEPGVGNPGAFFWVFLFGTMSVPLVLWVLWARSMSRLFAYSLATVFAFANPLFHGDRIPSAVFTLDGWCRAGLTMRWYSEVGSCHLESDSTVYYYLYSSELMIAVFCASVGFLLVTALWLVGNWQKYHDTSHLRWDFVGFALVCVGVFALSHEMTRQGWW